MFNTGAIARLRRLFRGAPALVEVPATMGVHPDPDLFELRTDFDPALASAAATRFERLFYGHQGRPVFKWPQYLPIYDAVLTPFVGRPCTLLEIGVAGGGSLQLWREFLGPQCRILGVDIEPGALSLAGPGVDIMIGDQGDPAFLDDVAQRVGAIDIVVDDGSHQVAHQILAFELLFPRMKPGGVYICEDLHTSYWTVYGGGVGRPGTFIEYLKGLLDRMHARYSGGAPEPDDLARSVGRITIADSIAVLHKAEPVETRMIRVGGA